ncbi:hypothetical protein Tco_0123654 [Tanacetum coccineum]
MSNSNTNLRTQSSSVLQNHTVSSCSTSKVQEKTQLSRIKCMNSLRAIQSQLKFLIETLQDFGNMPIFKRTFSQDLDLLENHLTKEIISQTDCKTTLTKLRTTFENAFSSEIKALLGKPVLPSLRNQSVVRQPNAFKSKRAQMLKQLFASQVDVNKFAKPVTQPYLPKKNRNPAFAKPNHMIAASSSRNSSKNLPRFSSNDMVHNHYLDVAKKKIQERDRNSTTSGTTSARFQSTTDDSKPKPRSNNQTSKSLHVSKSSRFTITDVPKADHSNSSSSFSYSKQFVCSTCHKCVFNANHDACITKLLKEIFTGHRFSPNKTSVVYEKTSPRFDLRWKPTGRILKSIGLRWIPTGKLFNSWTSKKEPSLDFNVQVSTEVHQAAETVTTSNELDLLFGPLFDEYFNGENQVVLKSSAVTTTDASNKRQQPDSTSSTSTLATTVTANGNFDL